MASTAERLLDGRVRLKHLTLVAAIAEQGSLVGAAHALNVTQPHVSRGLQEIEAAIGAPLFERGARGVIPTPQGGIFIDHAHAVLNTMRHAGARLEDYALGRTSGHVRVGVNLATVHRLLPEAILLFKQGFPHVTVSLLEEYQHALTGMLNRGEIDMIIGRLPTERADEHRYLRLLDDPLVLAVRNGHPGVGVTVTVPDLMSYPWVLPGHSSVFRGELDGLFRIHGLDQPRNLIESSTFTATKPILEQTDAIAALPQSLVDEEDMLAPLAPSLDAVPAEIGVTIKAGSVSDNARTQLIASVLDAARGTVPSPQQVADSLSLAHDFVEDADGGPSSRTLR
ncbi:MULTISPECIES: LysR family transcriptional regulator [Actinomycetes]|uniref:LysR substrate-binding domain-containing protein n=2 Tax=Actinomycetes TaxID=1760 RepID=A0ABP6LYT7_9MICC